MRPWPFGLERNIVAVSAAMFLLALGESLWKRFLPKYLEALGAPVTAIGLFGTCEDFLDGVYQYPGGWIGDRYGRRSCGGSRSPWRRRWADSRSRRMGSSAASVSASG